MMKIAFALYLIIYLGVWLGGVNDDYKQKRNILIVLCEALSGVFIISYVIAYAFSSSLENLLMPYLMPMMIASVAWELYAGVRDTSEVYREIKEQESNTKRDAHLVCLTTVIILVLVMAPGFYAGISLLMNS